MDFARFVHLHAHSDFSLLSGAMSVSAMLERMVQLKQPAVALTDYGNLFGAVSFYTQAMKLGIKPILGCEVYLCDDHTQRVSQGPRAPRYAQLVLLARTNHGWRNLMQLVSIGYLDGFYYKPRIDKALLRQYGAGLIALSSGWNGEIEQHLQRGEVDAARSAAIEYRELFPEHGFFIELQRNGAPAQEEINRQLIELAHELDIPLVASNNAHFLQRGDFQAFEAMLAIGQNRTLNDDVTGHFSPECYLKSHDEMAELFADVPEALENTLHIANRCNVDLQFGHYQLPDFQPPDGQDLNEFIRAEARRGLDERWPAIVAGSPEAKRGDYDARLAFELDVIEQMGFPGYFLIVSDFIRWAKAQDIPVGPGRGSGAGSLAAYCLKITDLDPIRYGLLFERFLNPERISMPDFDVDFCMSRRDEVIRYVTDKYGADQVAQIITYGSMKAKAVVRDVGRVLAMPLEKVNIIAKLVPNDLKMTLEKALVAEPRLQKMVDEDGEVARLFDIARRLEGLHRHAGKHAAGVVIGRTALVETAPLYKEAGEEGIVVQWDMKCVEKVGLVKFDFLGLKTLTVIHLACRLVREHAADEAGRAFDLERIPLDDAATFALLQRAATGAVFQLESSGMRDLMMRLKPDCFEDIIALVALFRPGPLQSGMVDDFIARKRGDQAVTYALPQLEPILKETYGVILYQEQVMQIAQVLAGYTLGQADMLRRAMGKKIPEEMAKQRKVFMDGATKHHVPEDKAERIFDLMEKFAEYGFNKSHSAAYALIAYQTAYLKAHYPQAFMAATLTCDMGNSDKVAVLVADCRAMGIDMLAPDVNASDWEFLPEGQAIRFGLGAVKGVGEAAIRALVKARNKGGRFADIEDMLMRVSAKALNKRILEALLKAGACNAIEANARAVLEGLGEVLDRTQRRRKELSAGQSALFEAAEPAPQAADGVAESWSLGEQLQAEREVLGFYLTGHPLEEHLGRVSGLADTHLGQLGTLADGAKVTLVAAVGGLREHRGARGTMAFVQIEDLHGRSELVCFANLFGKVRDLLQPDTPVLVAARVDASREEPVLIAEAIESFETALPQLVGRIRLDLGSLGLDDLTLARLKGLMGRDGTARLSFRVHLPDGSVAELESGAGIPWTPELQAQLESRFGRQAVHLECRPWQPVVDQRQKRG